MDITDFMILKAIADLRIAYPKAEKINSIVKLDPEELGARLGVLEMEGYIKTQSGMDATVPSLPNGISAAKITDAGRRVLTGGRW